MTSGPFAFVRNLQTSGGSNLKQFSQIQSAEAHAKRQDRTSQNRQDEGRSHETNYFWSKVGEGLDDGGADYTAAYKIHKKEMGVTTERKGAAIGQHLLVGVSPEWLAETGDPRDLSNPRVKELIKQAKDWAESWMGKGAVWAVRYDTDEKGSGVVDILASPVRTAHHKSGQSKPSISVRKANTELAKKHGRPNAFQAMQDGWALWASERLSERLQRGIPQKETRREHLTPEAYSAALSEREERLKAREERLEGRAAATLTKRQQWYERGFDALTAVLRRMLKPADLDLVKKAYEAEVNKPRSPEQPKPQTPRRNSGWSGPSGP